MKLLYTISECCRLASIGRTKFYELVGRGEIPMRKIGKKTLIAAADLQHWVDQLPTLKINGGERSDSHSEPPQLKTLKVPEESERDLLNKRAATYGGDRA